MPESNSLTIPSKPLSQNRNSQPIVVIPSDASEDEINKALEFATVYDKNGNPICGQKRYHEHRMCKRTAGWGSDHFGYGSCKDHDLSSKVEMIYLPAVNDDEVKSFIEEYQENQDALANNDNELTIAKALLMVRLKAFNSRELNTPEGRVAFNDVKGCLALIDKMSLTKNELQKTGKDMISRLEVAQYFSKVGMILQQELRNNCSNCRFEHNMQTRVLERIEKLGSIGMA